MKRLAALLLLALPTQSRLWRPEERALVTDFSYVEAVAVSPTYVFGATRHGLIVYDRHARRWELPVTALDGYPPVRVRAALADPIGNAVWLGTDDGYARYDLDTRRWERAQIGLSVSDLAFDARDPVGGIYLRTRSGWRYAARAIAGALESRPLPPPGQRIATLSPQAALDQAPTADAMRALILTDARLRAHQFTSAARTPPPDREELFFGTDGMGLVRVDPATGEWEGLPYGLLAPGVGSVASGGEPGGVWAAAAARPGERRGLTWVSADLSRTSASEGGGAALGFAFLEGRRLLASGKHLWVATERGLLRIDQDSHRARVFDVGRGLPSEDVTSLAPAPDGVWVGTARGLAVVTWADRVVTLGPPGQPVLALLAVRDTLWIGTATGVQVLLPGSSETVVPGELAEVPALRVPIVALARLRDTIVAATSNQLAWRNAATGKWTLLRTLPALGAVTALAGDAGGGGAWIGGIAGLAFTDVGRSHILVLPVPGDVPAAVRDVVVDGDYLWVGTDSGLVRFRRDAVLPR